MYNQITLWWQHCKSIKLKKNKPCISIGAFPTGFSLLVLSSFNHLSTVREILSWNLNKGILKRGHWCICVCNIKLSWWVLPLQRGTGGLGWEGASLFSKCFHTVKSFSPIYENLLVLSSLLFYLTQSTKEKTSTWCSKILFQIPWRRHFCSNSRLLYKERSESISRLKMKVNLSQDQRAQNRNQGLCSLSGFWVWKLDVWMESGPDENRTDHTQKGIDLWAPAKETGTTAWGLSPQAVAYCKLGDQAWDSPSGSGYDWDLNQGPHSPVTGSAMTLSSHMGWGLLTTLRKCEPMLGTTWNPRQRRQVEIENNRQIKEKTTNSKWVCKIKL